MDQRSLTLLLYWLCVGCLIGVWRAHCHGARGVFFIKKLGYYGEEEQHEDA